jgi:hypothetical protein
MSFPTRLSRIQSYLGCSLPAILASAAGSIGAHNHPSGDLTPSADDIEITKKLARAADIMGTPLLDPRDRGDSGPLREPQGLRDFWTSVKAL